MRIKFARKIFEKYHYNLCGESSQNLPLTAPFWISLTLTMVIWLMTNDSSDVSLNILVLFLPWAMFTWPGYCKDQRCPSICWAVYLQLRIWMQIVSTKNKWEVSPQNFLSYLGHCSKKSRIWYTIRSNKLHLRFHIDSTHSVASISIANGNKLTDPGERKAIFKSCTACDESY